MYNHRTEHIAGKTGYVNVFACHLLGDGVWLSPAASWPHGANPAWSGDSGGREGIENLQAPTAKAESPKEVKQTEDFSTPRKSAKRCTRARKVKKTHGQGWTWTTTKISCPKAQRFGKDAGGGSNPGPDHEGRRLPDAAWAPGREFLSMMRWGLSLGCSDPRPRQGEIRIADDV